MNGIDVFPLALANGALPWPAILMCLTAAAGLCLVIAWIWRREARRVFPASDDEPTEVDHFWEGWR